jgi:hypothetical protein
MGFPTFNQLTDQLTDQLLQEDPGEPEVSYVLFIFKLSFCLWYSIYMYVYYIPMCHNLLFKIFIFYYCSGKSGVHRELVSTGGFQVLPAMQCAVSHQEHWQPSRALAAA